MFNKKYKKVIIISIIIVAITAFIGLFIASHSTYFKYNDWWIIGQNAEKIEARYGQFEASLKHPHSEFPKQGFYEIFSISRHYLGGQREYFIVIFDDFGIAIETRRGGYPGG
ncbi:MAG: hypothetical protein FWH20_05835 [Oscillospiraceae bacterium]|nr:hypothetical protein [Oscillospiraceae bacterium]